MPEARNIPLSKEQPRGALQTPPRNNLEGYKAPLIARVHLRLGMWRWTITPAEVCPSKFLRNKIAALPPSKVLLIINYSTSCLHHLQSQEWCCEHC